MNEFLEFLKKFAATLTTDEVVQAANTLKATPATQPVFQTIFDLGHGSATRDHNKKVKDIEKERDDAKASVVVIQTEFDEYKAKAPDIKAVEDKWKEEVKKLEKKNSEQTAAFKAERLTWYRDRAVQDIAVLLSKRGVDPEWAEYIMSKAENQSRLRVVEGEDGKYKVEVLKSGSDVTTLQADKPYEAFADELRKDVKPQYITSNADKGTGNKGGNTGSGDKSVYDRAREETKKQTEATARPEGYKSGAERLGIR